LRKFLSLILILIAFSSCSQDFTAHHFSGDSLNFLQNYDEDFFRENYLVYFFLDQPTTALGYEVGSVRENGNIIIERLPDAGGAGTMITHWTFVLEFENTFSPESFNIIFPRENRWWYENVTVHVYRGGSS
jgi:hypothetical protein